MKKDWFFTHKDRQFKNMQSSNPIPLVPCNYFGKGENYNLQEDNPTQVAEFERLWKEWEEAHPEDPTGEIALEDYKKRNRLVPEEIITKKSIEQDLEESSKIHLELPERLILKLKNYARFRRRRPRDIVASWIEQFARL